MRWLFPGGWRLFRNKVKIPYKEDEGSGRSLANIDQFLSLAKRHQNFGRILEDFNSCIEAPVLNSNSKNIFFILLVFLFSVVTSIEAELFLTHFLNKCTYFNNILGQNVFVG